MSPSLRYVAKSDDNVELDMEGLVSSLQARQGEGREDVITCPTVSYNMKVIRSSSGGMTGAWSESVEDWERDSLPTFCVGFLSVTTPRLAAQLAQVGLELYRSDWSTLIGRAPTLLRSDWSRGSEC